MGKATRCTWCSARKRACPDCGKAFEGRYVRCSACYRLGLDPDLVVARNRSGHNTRRARKLGAQVTGPVPPAVYEAIRLSGPCVYCGDSATTVDHVRPLARDGWEHESNLVPACGRCNSSKHDRLLTEWELIWPGRVRHGVEHSPEVAAEYEWLISNTCEQWTDALSNSGGQTQGAGNITGVNACG